MVVQNPFQINGAALESTVRLEKGMVREGLVTNVSL